MEPLEIVEKTIHLIEINRNTFLADLKRSQMNATGMWRINVAAPKEGIGSFYRATPAISNAD
jgi:hypothetical protein